MFLNYRNLNLKTPECQCAVRLTCHKYNFGIFCIAYSVIELLEGDRRCIEKKDFPSKNYP